MWHMRVPGHVLGSKTERLARIQDPKCCNTELQVCVAAAVTGASVTAKADSSLRRTCDSRLWPY